MKSAPAEQSKPPSPAPEVVKKPAKPKVAKPGDAGPLLAALNHFRSLPDLPGPKDDGVLLVEKYYGGKSGFLSADQLRSELSEEGWTIPEEARADLERRARGEGRVSFAKLPPTLQLFEFTEEDTYFQFRNRHPGTCAWVSMWRPGFTKDGRQAVVRFMFGPTPHGAAATYLLERRDDGWHVVHHSLSYFA
ncbi:hypothetical protein [Luteolibacter soli]|uniref:SnoaL-like domain-containing protein n=1 Tax=Luteolibacter soli TaxID=3135280 RepID=A0ABU9AVX6_9BACT